jgi:GMP synthase (glutamine-hydrolysing)
MHEFKNTEIDRIRSLDGPMGQATGAVSGGVDSTVAAKLMHEAISDRFHAVFVDNGVLRMNETKMVKKTLTKSLGINLTVVDASCRFLEAFRGVADPETKRKIIGNLFVTIFQETADRIVEEARNTPFAARSTS